MILPRTVNQIMRNGLKSDLHILECIVTCLDMAVLSNIIVEVRSDSVAYAHKTGLQFWCCAIVQSCPHGVVY